MAILTRRETEDKSGQGVLTESTQNTNGSQASRDVSTSSESRVEQGYESTTTETTGGSRSVSTQSQPETTTSQVSTEDRGGTISFAIGFPPKTRPVNPDGPTEC